MINLVIASKKWHNNGSTLDNILASGIKIVTQEEYFHTEIIFEDIWYGMNTNGLEISILKPLKDNWNYQLITVDEKYRDVILEYLAWASSRQYDWLGAVKSKYSCFPEDTRKYYCTELVCEILQACDVSSVEYLDVATVTPGELWNILDVK